MSEDVYSLAKVETGGYSASEYIAMHGWVVDAVYRCDCGATFVNIGKEKPRFCPACGRRYESADGVYVWSSDPDEQS